ncbi:MAG TPA: glutathione S-transferase family protein [Myxococcaceae bacterium]|jgi:glutathione S-transferase
MPMKLYFNPVSSYSQKALLALYEKGCPFEPEIVNLFDPKAREAYQKVYPIGKVPFLQVAEKKLGLSEASVIVEYLDRTFSSGPKLIPEEVEQALQVRMLDRFFDLYITESVTKIFFDGMRPEGQKDPFGVQQARDRLDSTYAFFESHLAGKTWAAGDAFSLADCAAAPALFYARMIQPFEAHKNVSAYFDRLMQRPAYQRVVKEAEPFLAMFK